MKSVVYCLFCKKGLEDKISEYFNNIQEDVIAIAPTKILYEKRRNKWITKEVCLIPNYIFVYTKDDINISELTRLSDAYRVLQYGDGQRQLEGKDLDYALWIRSNQGKIQVSKYIQEGSKIKITEGPLSDNIGIIQKVDKHKRRIWVMFDFDGQIREVVLSAECVAVL